jgi:hypothetical protein
MISSQMEISGSSWMHHFPVLKFTQGQSLKNLAFEGVHRIIVFLTEKERVSSHQIKTYVGVLDGIEVD